jgi:hypothetical protein
MRHVLILVLGHRFLQDLLDEEENIRKVTLPKIIKYILDWEMVCGLLKGIEFSL